ncbi:MAG: carboxypeptidase regulatory-like domain-containing protein, partial [Acidobacteriaceae bacterium]
MTSKLYKVLSLFVMFGVFAVGALAQNANSSIQGTVKDVHGAVVPNAAVTLTNLGTSQATDATANATGFYIFANLAPGNYRVSVSASSFANWIGVLTLRVSTNATVDATLVAASVSTKVTVRDVTPVIDRVDPTLSDVKNSTAIETVPTEGRNILAVLAFSPGVVANSYGGAGGGYTRVNGVPGGSMAYLVDGQTMATHWSNELQQDPQTTMTFQEVKIITAQGDAQYNKPGVVELVTKSGTNHFHGQAYELNTNNHLQARAFNSGTVINFDQHNEYGAQLGGPVWFPKIYNGKNKTFFFVDWEQLKDKQNAFEQYYVPTMSERGGDLSDLASGGTGDPINIYDPASTVYDPVTDAYTRTPFTNNTIPTTELNPIATEELGINPPAGIFPLAEPNVPGVTIKDVAVNGQANLIPSNISTPTDETTLTAKLDQIFGRNRLAARYTYT